MDNYLSLFINVFHPQTLFNQKKIILKVLNKQENIYLMHLKSFNRKIVKLEIVFYLLDEK